jgi:hypothetical protein
VRVDRRFRIQIVSAPDDEELVAEVWRGEEMLAELRHEAIGVAVRLFPRRDGATWDFRPRA